MGNRRLGLWFVLALGAFPFPARSQGPCQGIIEGSNCDNVMGFYRYACAVRPFDDIFELWATQEVFDTWSDADFVTFMNAVIDSNQANDEDVFPVLWDYFCYSDDDPAWDSIAFTLGTVTYTRVKLFLWSGSGTAPANTVSNNKVCFSVEDLSGNVLMPMDAARGAFPHEFVHLTQSANTSGPVSGWSYEMQASAAGYVLGERYTTCQYDKYFDKSFTGTPGGSWEYVQFYLFHAYLLEHFSGDPAVRADDLLYGWARADDLTFNGLSQAIEEDPVYSDMIPGVDGTEKMGNLFHRHVMARYIDRPDTLDGMFGFGQTASSRDFCFFDWVDPNGLRARTVPPRFVLGAEETTSVTASQFLDPLDSKPAPCGLKNLGIRRWGADYLAFSADSSFFAQNGDTLLDVAIRGLEPMAAGRRVRVGYVAYGSRDGTLYDKPILEIVEQVEVKEADTLEVRFCIDQFGETIKGVLVAVSMVDDPTFPPAQHCFDEATVCFDEAGGTCTQPEVPYAVTYGYAARTLTVPSEEYETIQAAIDAAMPPQRVGVFSREEPYPESLRMKKGIRVFSTDGPGLASLSRPDTSVVVHFPVGTDAATVLDGINVDGGTVATVLFEGPGKIANATIEPSPAGLGVSVIQGENADFQVSNCRILVAHAGWPFVVNGIEAVGGIVVIDGTVVEMSGVGWQDLFHGIYTAPGNDPDQQASITGCLIRGGVGNSGTGIRALGSDVITRCTVDSVSRGAYLDAEALMQESIISHHDPYQGAEGSGTLHDCIISGLASYLLNRTGAVLELTDPLYCGYGAYTLRVDSQGNPEINESVFGSPKQVGAFLVGCMYGTLARDAVFSDGQLDVTGDVLVPVGRVLSLGPGVLAVVADADNQETGGDPATVEIRVEGTLDCTGAPLDSVVIQAGSGARGSWDGLVVGEHARLLLVDTRVSDARYGLRDESDFPADSIHIEGCRIDHFETAGVFLSPNQAAGPPASCRVVSTTIDMKGAPYGLYLGASTWSGGPSYSYSVEYCSIDADSAGQYGIYLNAYGVGEAPAMLAYDIVSRLHNGTGIYVLDNDSVLLYNAVYSCKTGIVLSGIGAPIIEGGFYDVNRCHVGLQVRDAVTAVVDSMKIWGSTVAALYTDDQGGGTFSNLQIEKIVNRSLQTGFKSWSTAPQVLRTSTIQDFTWYGVWASSGSLVDLGSEEDGGANFIYSADAIRYVNVKNRVPELGNIPAICNDWGSPNPPASKFSTAVDYIPFIPQTGCGSMSPQVVDLAGLATPPGPYARLAANPFTAGLEVRMGSGGASWGSVEVFDLTGRRVCDLFHGTLEQEMRISWDGRAADGRPASAGIYFIRARAGREIWTLKAVKLPEGTR